MVYTLGRPLPVIPSPPSDCGLSLVNDRRFTNFAEGAQRDALVWLMFRWPHLVNAHPIWMVCEHRCLWSHVGKRALRLACVGVHGVEAGWIAFREDFSSREVVWWT